MTQNTSSKYGRLLVIEPDPLLRWSLATYFSRWYEVCEAQDEAVAQGVIEQGGIDALIVADALGDAANRLVTSAKEGNAVLAVIRTVTRLPDATHAEDGIHFVEKPFQLSQLAELLGITSANMRRNA